ncbi:inosine/xanthosine triphosphatase [Patescibacteria group bacterium]
MKINIGSKNKVKIQALQEAVQDYDFLKNAEVRGIEIDSEVSDQPKSAEETIKGAMNRAKKAYKDCKYSFGLEDGLMKVPMTKTDYMNICACAIFDGKEFHIGLGSAYEYPHEVARLVFEEGLDIEQAFYKTGLSKNPKLGSAEGAISVLTHGRLNRKGYTKQAIMMALIHLENEKLF